MVYMSDSMSNLLRKHITQKIRICYFLIPVALLTCCRPENKTPLQFQYLDLSFNKGPDGITSVYLDSTKVLKIGLISVDLRTTYFCDTLHDTTLRHINKLVGDLLSYKLDTVAGMPGCFSFPFYFDIKGKKKHLQTLLYVDQSRSVTPFTPLVTYIYSLTANHKISPVKSGFEFKSLKKVQGPPPPAIVPFPKFIPPIIKESAVE